MIDVVAEGETPMISLASSAKIIEPVDAKRHWVFKTPQTDAMMASAIAEHASNHGVKTMAYIGQADALGETFYAEVAKFAAACTTSAIVANERFNRTDPSVTGQVLKILAAQPDAVVVGAAGTPAALPPKTLKERGYKGMIYHNHGVGQSRLPARVRRGLQRHFPADEPGARRRATARRSSGETPCARLHQAVSKRSTARAGLGVRLVCVGRGHVAEPTRCRSR